nr:ABC transporter ATP-binding protein [Streptomyces zagrosensis]
MRGGQYIAAVSDATFELRPGECLALVGESGCGKSVLASALLGLLPGNAETAGTAHLGGPAGTEPVELLTAGEQVLSRTIRGRRVGLIPQSPAAHLTPVRTVRAQLEETVRELTRIRRPRLRRAAETAAERAAFPADHLDRYPHQLSGGLAQRAATALALVGDAALLLADEPTTGLDRDLVEHTVDELRRHISPTPARAPTPAPVQDPACASNAAPDADAATAAGPATSPGPAAGTGARDTAMSSDRGADPAADTVSRPVPQARALLMITHDLAAAQRVADRVAVMYAGRIVELSDARDFFGAPGPRHPYARRLLDALPERSFTPIAGMPPELGHLPPGCSFAPRCDQANDQCATLPTLTDGVACHHAPPPAYRAPLAGPGQRAEAGPASAPCSVADKPRATLPDDGGPGTIASDSGPRTNEAHHA